MTFGQPYLADYVKDRLIEDAQRQEQAIQDALDAAHPERPLVVCNHMEVLDVEWIAGRQVVRDNRIPPGTAYYISVEKRREMGL